MLLETTNFIYFQGIKTLAESNRLTNTASQLIAILLPTEDRKSRTRGTNVHVRSGIKI
jgi:hypothetical protein